VVIYEVYLEVDRSIEKRYLHWFKSEHVPEVLACEGFEKAEVLYDTSGDSVRIRSLYFVSHASFLEKYLEKHAPNLRQKSADKWGDKFKANRFIWPESVTIVKKS
jgi:hypothetical protein